MRLAVRALLKQPGYAAAVLATLSLGMGATTAMFSVIDAALFRPLPFVDPDRLVMLWGVAGPEREIRGASFLETRDWRDMNRALQAVSAYDEISLNLRAGTEVLRIDGEMVSASFFPLLGVQAARGRTFTPDEDAAPDARPVALVSHNLWVDRLAAKEDVVGSTLVLNDRTFTIVGVMPERFAGLSFDTDVWVPMMMVSLTSAPLVLEDRGTRWLGAVGRLKNGVTLETAQRDLDLVAQRLAQTYPDTNTQRGVRLLTVKDNYLGETASLLVILFGAVVALLLVACANVAALQLVRTSARRREIAVRFAVGARRGHIVRQFLAESLVLAIGSAAAGTIIASWSLEALISLTPENALPTYVRPLIDARAVGFSLVAALASSGLIGLTTAMRASQGSFFEALKDGSRAAAPGLGRIRRPAPQQILVAGQMAVAVILLGTAGVMIRSLQQQVSTPLGFRPERVVAARVALPGERYRAPERTLFAQRLVEQLSSLPFVRAASVSSDLPFTGNSSAGMLFTGGDPRSRIRFYRHMVTPRFFSTLGVPLIRGRMFTDDDRQQSAAVVIVGESAARRLWPGEDAVGKRFRLGGPDGPEVEVVGVVGTVRFRNLNADLTAPGSEPDVYFPFTQRTDRDIELAVLSTDGRLVPLAVLQQAVRALDPGLPVYAVQPLSEAVRQQTATTRFGATLLSLFSVGAVLLAAIGLYSLVAYVVNLGRREIAIRMALGADPRRMIALVLRNGATIVSAGLVCGIAGAVAIARVLQNQLVGMLPFDAVTLVVASGLLLLTALFATYLPARAATKVDPQLALKAE